jgi:hypothetical protein
VRTLFVSKTFDHLTPNHATFQFTAPPVRLVRMMLIRDLQRLLPAELLVDSGLSDCGISFTVTDVAKARDLLLPVLPEIAEQMT